MTITRWREAVRMTSPVFFGYIAIGIPFGLMCVKAGYPVWMSPVMSIIMYAGAGQYVAMGLFASGASMASVAITQLLVNCRHIVYGLSLIDRFKSAGRRRLYMIFALTDETYSLLTSCRDRDQMRGEKPGEFCCAVALLDHIYWILGGVIGAVAGTVIPFSLEGVDFALTALFAVLLIEQIKKAILAPGTSDGEGAQSQSASGDTRPPANMSANGGERRRTRKMGILPPVIGVCTTTAAIVSSRVGILSSSNILIAAMVLGLVLLIALCRKTPVKEQQRTGENGQVEAGIIQGEGV